MESPSLNRTYKKVVEEAQDFLPILGTDYVELIVGNAKQSAHYFKTAFGFQDLAFSGMETGQKDRVSYVLQQGKIRLVITAPLTPESDLWEHVRTHGDGVKVVALWVEDAAKAFQETVSRGAKPYLQPVEEEDAFGRVVKSGIHTYGETVHLFIERHEYHGPFLPGFVSHDSGFTPADSGLLYIDHMVGNVDWGQMNIWCAFYAEVMGFAQLISFDDKDISTDYTALMSKVMSNGSGYIKFPINEPAKGKKKSQIEEYIDYYRGAGVQHIAVATDDIVSTVTDLRARGVQFLDVPDSYYDDLVQRVGQIDEEIEVLKSLRILVDRDEQGYLLQLFTKPVVDRPTIFIEIIQRTGATSFGKGNFKALFESIEREQELRGTL